MIVTCENCDARFNLDENLIKESGSKVKCSKCHHIFTAYPPVQAEESEPALDLEEVSADLPESETDEVPEEPAIAAEESTEEEVALEELSLEEETAEDETATAEEPAIDETLEPAEEAAEEIPELEIEETAEEETPEAAEEPAEETPDLEIDETEEKPAEEAEEEVALEELSLEEEPAEEETPEAAEEAPDLELDEAEEEAAVEEPSLEEEAAKVEEEPAEDETLEPAEEAAEEIPELEIEETAEEETPEAEEKDAVTEEAEAQEEPTEELPDAVSVESVEEAKDAATEQVEETPMPPPVSEGEPPVRKRISTPVVIMLIFAVLVGGAFAAYSLLKSFDINIPLLESLTGAPEPTTIDSGNLRITLLDQLIKGEFVENSTIGHLFVIKGKARNDYLEARNFIMVKGVLYSKGGEAVQHKTVYCGNTLSDTDLQALDKATIDKRLRNKFGDERSNFRVPSGKVLPFVVVFSGLPQDLGEFSVEVVSSVQE